MLPIRDHEPTRTIPFVNYILIVICVLVFIYSSFAVDFEAFLYLYGFIPESAKLFDTNTWIRIISSMFLHGSTMHLVGNMWFLHIFGDNIEDRLGHIKYLLFYIASGLSAILLQYVFSSNSIVPNIGASGAIAGVIGSYMVIFKNAQIETLVPGFGMYRTILLPAVVVLGYWIATQIFSGVGSLSNVDVNSGGVAWFAHIGGFAFGYIFSKLFENKLSF